LSLNGTSEAPYRQKGFSLYAESPENSLKVDWSSKVLEHVGFSLQIRHGYYSLSFATVVFYTVSQPIPYDTAGSERSGH
jgi:hypothetical protein